MKSKFKGILQGFDFENLDERSKAILIEKEVFVLPPRRDLNSTENSEEDIVKSFLSELNPSYFYFNLLIDDEVYVINHEIHNEIYNFLSETIENSYAIIHSLPEAILEIKLEFDALLIEDEKLEYLNKIKAEEFKNFKASYENENDDFPWSYGLTAARPGSEEFKNYILSCIRGSLETIKFHLLGIDYNDDATDWLCQELEECESDYISFWMNAIWYYKIMDFINLLSSPNSQKTTYSKLPPLHQIALIDSLRNKEINLTNLNKTQINELISNFSGSFMNSELTIQSLNNLIIMNQTDYDSLVETKSHYASYVKSFSASSEDNIRKAISDFNLSFNRQTNLTEKQKQQNKKFKEIQTKLKKIYPEIEKILESLGI
jgi:hypothetical protein